MKSDVKQVPLVSEAREMLSATRRYRPVLYHIFRRHSLELTYPQRRWNRSARDHRIQALARCNYWDNTYLDAERFLLLHGHGCLPSRHTPLW
jgi:hypothetical protein